MIVTTEFDSPRIRRLTLVALQSQFGARFKGMPTPYSIEFADDLTSAEADQVQNIIDKCSERLVLTPAIKADFQAATTIAQLKAVLVKVFKLV
jgi:hypothetical protein